MKDKLELQKQYIEVKNKYDESSDFYWTLDENPMYTVMGSSSKKDYKEEIEVEIKEQFLLLKSLNKQIYYER